MAKKSMAKRLFPKKVAAEKKVEDVSRLSSKCKEEVVTSDPNQLILFAEQELFGYADMS